jgi:hypothetical protein
VHVLADRWGNLAERPDIKHTGGAPAKSGASRRAGKTLERKNPGGARPRRILNRYADGTDSQGEQGREAGQRHLPHLLGMVGWCAGGPTF